MKAILEFDLPTERDEFELCSHAIDLKVALEDVDMKLRALLKHGTPDDYSAIVAEECRQIIGEIKAKVEA